MIEMAQKTIVIGEGTSNVDINQTIVQPETQPEVLKWVECPSLQDMAGE